MSDDRSNTDGPGTDRDPAIESETSLVTRSGLPASATWLRELFADAPWREHPNYAGLAAFWQQVHRGLRSEGGDLRTLLDLFRNGDHDPSMFERAFSLRLRQFLGHLEFHHQIEDDAYFPRFRLLDDRLVAGFDLLETDHRIIHEQLVKVADSGQLLLGSLRSQDREMRRHLDTHADAADRLIRLLERHLDDEEDLVIPAILKHGDRAVS